MTYYERIKAAPSVKVPCEFRDRIECDDSLGVLEIKCEAAGLSRRVLVALRYGTEHGSVSPTNGAFVLKLYSSDTHSLIDAPRTPAGSPDGDSSEMYKTLAVDSAKQAL